MVQPSIRETPARPAAAHHAQLPADSAPPLHDEILLIAALERVENTRIVLEEVLSAEVSALLYV